MSAVTTINTVAQLTLERSQKDLQLAAVKGNKLYAYMLANNRIKFEDGGSEISNPLIFGRNPNIAAYSYYDTLPLTQTDEFDKVSYGWSRVAASLIISNQELDENQGVSAVAKILDGKMIALKESIKEKFSTYLYGAGAGSDPYGLQNAVPDDPTTGTFGGINRATQNQWRTSAYDCGASPLDSTTIIEAMDDILLDLTQKSDRPDVIFIGRNLRRIYMQAIRDNMMVTLADMPGPAGKKMADLGISGFAHENIPIIYDEDCPADKMYFLNTKYLRYHVMKHVNMRTENLVAPWTVDAMGKRIVWQGQLCLWRAYRTHAVLINA